MSRRFFYTGATPESYSLRDKLTTQNDDRRSLRGPSAAMALTDSSIPVTRRLADGGGPRPQCAAGAQWAAMIAKSAPKTAPIVTRPERCGSARYRNRLLITFPAPQFSYLENPG